ncbi:MAG: transposase [Nostocaceae cyanobacterium]|nr:transposase [Nostocaceae cyanobacterium]
MGNVKPIWSRELPSGFPSFDSTETAKTRTCSPSAPTSVTVLKDSAKRYFLSFVVKVEPIQIDAKNQSIGIDLGIKTFAVMSDGTKAESPNYSNLDRKIPKLQEKLARQPSYSKCKNATRIRIAKLHHKIADIRQDFLQKLSTKVVNENQVIKPFATGLITHR